LAEANRIRKVEGVEDDRIRKLEATNLKCSYMNIENFRTILQKILCATKSILCAISQNSTGFDFLIRTQAYAQSTIQQVFVARCCQ
jgi:hypothetical protein